MISIRDAETIMEAKDFRGFIDQLSDLTETQRDVLRIALTAKGGDAKIVAMIEPPIPPAAIAAPRRSKAEAMLTV